MTHTHAGRALYLSIPIANRYRNTQIHTAPRLQESDRRRRAMHVPTPGFWTERRDCIRTAETPCGKGLSQRGAGRARTDGDQIMRPRPPRSSRSDLKYGSANSGPDGENVKSEEPVYR